MKWLRTISWGIFGLFVDNGSFALIILIWIVLTTQILGRTNWFPEWRGLLLFCGLALILAASAVQYARKKKR